VIGALSDTDALSLDEDVQSIRSLRTLLLQRASLEVAYVRRASEAGFVDHERPYHSEAYSYCVLTFGAAFRVYGGRVFLLGNGHLSMHKSPWHSCFGVFTADAWKTLGMVVRGTHARAI